jgi:hypothetical protein
MNYFTRSGTTRIKIRLQLPPSHPVLSASFSPRTLCSYRAGMFVAVRTALLYSKPREPKDKKKVSICAPSAEVWLQENTAFSSPDLTLLFILFIDYYYLFIRH